MKYTLVQDGDELADFDNLAEAASMLYGIAEAMARDASRITRMANALLDGTLTNPDAKLEYEGCYLSLSVEVSA